MLSKSIIFSCLFCFTSFVHLTAQHQFTEENQRAYRDLLRLKTNSENVRFFKGVAKPHKNGLDLYILNYLEIIHLLSVDDVHLYDSLKENEEGRLEILKKISKTSDESPYHSFIEAGVMLQWAVVKLKYEDNFSAFFDFRKGYKLLEQNEKEFPDSLPHKQWLGVMQVMFSKVPSRYQWILSLMGMEGNEEEGLKKLSLLINSDSEFRREAALFKAFLQMFVLDEGEEAFTNFHGFFQSDSSDYLSLFALTQVGLKTGKNNILLPLLEKVEISSEYSELGIFHHLKGQAYLQAGEYAKCVESMQYFLKSFQGDNYKKDAYFRMAMAYWFLNDADSCKYYLERVNEVGSAKINLDEYAASFSQLDKLPNKLLTQARFYSDGGYYSKALSCIGLIDFSALPEKEKVEYYYRKARIYHQLKEWQNAEEQYLNVLQNSTYKTVDYLPPNAALQLALVYVELDKPIKAKECFNKVLKYKESYPYKSDIRDKAKSELSRLD